MTSRVVTKMVTIITEDIQGFGMHEISYNSLHVIQNWLAHAVDNWLAREIKLGTVVQTILHTRNANLWHAHILTKTLGCQQAPKTISWLVLEPTIMV
jgi:hypothetical protein